MVSVKSVQSQGRILVVEDENVVARALGEFLGRLGYDVIGPAGVGEVAVALARIERPDLVLMDVRLKGRLDGPETAVQIKQNRDVPFVFLTAGTDDATVARLRAVEPHAFVIQPYVEHVLAMTIQMALTRARAEQAQCAAERARRQVEACFASILDHSHDGIVCVDRERRITIFNQGAERIFGCRSDEVLGEPLEVLLPLEHADAHVAHVEGFRRTGKSSRPMSGGREVRGRRRNGESFVAEVTISRVAVDGQEILAACVRDLTEWRALEKQFHQAQKMEIVGRFAASVAHDFNNLLTVIQTNTYLLRPQVSEPLRGQVDELSEAVEHGKALTSQLLGFSRHDPATLKNLDVNELVTRAVPLLRRLLGGAVVLRTDLSPNTGTVRADRNLLEQVLMNLVVNARDAMPQGGEITIRTSCALLEAGDRRLGLQRAPGRYSCLEVIDHGPGVLPALAERVFEPFFTTKPTGIGTGLGLPTVRAIARGAGGDAHVAPCSGRGATFVVLLPQVGDLAETEPPRSPEAPVVGGSEHVLVADDDPAVLRVTSRILEQHGYHVRGASSFQAALTILERNGLPLDLLISSAILAGGSGPELARTVSAVRPRAKVLLTTGDPSATTPAGHGPSDSRSVLIKPFSPDALLHAARAVLDAAKPPTA